MASLHQKKKEKKKRLQRGGAECHKGSQGGFQMTPYNKTNMGERLMNIF
jgi:hypothetical protein